MVCQKQALCTVLCMCIVAEGGSAKVVQGEWAVEFQCQLIHRQSFSQHSFYLHSGCYVLIYVLGYLFCQLVSYFEYRYMYYRAWKRGFILFAWSGCLFIAVVCNYFHLIVNSLQKICADFLSCIYISAKLQIQLEKLNFFGHKSVDL